MPKRIIDGEAMWSSDKVASLAPELQAEYAWLLPLAMANGVFECNPGLILSRCYSRRPRMTLAKVESILNAFTKVKLLFRWQHEGKAWGYWVGIDAPGRLPSPERRGKHEKVGPPVPEEELASFLGTDANGIQRNPLDANGCHWNPKKDTDLQVAESTTDTNGCQRIPSASSARAPEPNPKPNPIPTPKPSSVEVSAYEIPDWVPSEEWLAFVEMRRAIHKPLATKHAVEYAIKKLDKLRASGQDPGAVLRQSVLASWQGLFEVSEGKNDTRKTFAQQRTENNRRTLEQYRQSIAERYRGEPDAAGRGDGPGAVAGGAGAGGRGAGGPGP